MTLNEKCQEVSQNYLLKLESDDDNNYPPKTTTLNNINFDINKVANNDNSYKKYQQLLDNNLDLNKYNPDNFKEVYLCEMTPQDYLNYSRTYISHTSHVDIADYTDINNPRWKTTAKGCLDDSLKFKNGEKAPLLILDFKNIEQDGNHRAGGAYLSNIDKVSVLVCI